MPFIPSAPVRPSIFSAQQGLFTGLAQRAYDITGQLAELNLRLAQQLLLDAASASRQVLAAGDPIQAFSISVHAAQPAFDHVRAYQQELASLLTGLRTGGTHTARQRPEPGAAGAPSASASHAARADSAAAAAGYGRLH